MSEKISLREFEVPVKTRLFHKMQSIQPTKFLLLADPQDSADP